MAERRKRSPIGTVHNDPPCEQCTFCAARAEIERLRAREQDLRMHAEQDACEIERLRAEMQQVRLDHITTLGELQEAAAEIERLRAAGDVLAEWAAVDHSVEQCEDGCEYLAALRVWQEARRG